MSRAQDRGKRLEFLFPAKVYLTETDALTESETQPHHCRDAIRKTPRGSDASVVVDVGDSRSTAVVSLACVPLEYDLSID